MGRGSCLRVIQFLLPPACSQEFLFRRRQLPRRRMFRLLRPAARSAFGVHRLRPRTLHAAVRAEHAAIARPGAQHLVAVSALISQECLHGGHYLFPLGPAYRAGQYRNLDCSASHRAVDPAGFRGVIKALIFLRSQSCTASHAGIRLPLLAALAILRQRSSHSAPSASSRNRRSTKPNLAPRCFKAVPGFETRCLCGRDG